jgi:hypothetical protein
MKEIKYDAWKLFGKHYVSAPPTPCNDEFYSTTHIWMAKRIREYRELYPDAVVNGRIVNMPVFEAWLLDRKFEWGPA